MTRFFSKMISVTWLVIAIVGVAQTATPASGPTGPTAETAQQTPKPGVFRIGLVQPKVELGQIDANSGEALRALIAEHLAGPKVELMQIANALPELAQAEAIEKHCDYVLFIEFTQKKSQGMGLLRAAQAASSNLPMVGLLGRGSMIAGEVAAQTSLVTSAVLTRAVKAKSEVTLDYRLQAPGKTSPAVTNSEKLKVQSDGQDVFTPLIERLAIALSRVL